MGLCRAIKRLNTLHFSVDYISIGYISYNANITELQLNKANSFDTEAPFLDLNLSITNGIVTSKI